MFLLSLDEMERVRRANALPTFIAMEQRTKVTEKTWRTAFKTRRPTPAVLDALGALGARGNKILVWEDPADVARPRIREVMPA